MDFDTYIGGRGLSFNHDKVVSVKDLLFDFTYGEVNLDKIDFSYIDFGYTWCIDPNNGYTRRLFYTDREILLRGFKIRKLMENGLQ